MSFLLKQKSNEILFSYYTPNSAKYPPIYYLILTYLLTFIRVFVSLFSYFPYKKRIMELKELYNSITGERLYLNHDERERFYNATKFQENDIKYFCQMLYFTGCRLNEVINILYGRIDFNEQGVIIETLKRRRKGVFRFLDLPEDFLERLNDVYDIKSQQKEKQSNNIWSFTGRTGQNYIKKVMNEADITGKKACAKGLRHSFGVKAIENQVPISQLKEWLGHRYIDSTAIYLQAKGKERRNLAKRMWD